MDLVDLQPVTRNEDVMISQAQPSPNALDGVYFTQVGLTNPTRTGDASVYCACGKGCEFMSPLTQSAQSLNQHPSTHTVMFPHTCVRMHVYKQPCDLTVKKILNLHNLNGIELFNS